MKIGIISDTHNLLRPEVVSVLRDCGCVLHGGDVSNEQTLEELREISTVYAVRGNNDKGPWAEELPEQLRITIGGIRFFVVHNKKDVPAGLDPGRVDVVVFGHSHKYFCEERDGIWRLNPGSCGKRRFGLPITMAVMEIEEGHLRIEALDFTEQK